MIGREACTEKDRRAEARARADLERPGEQHEITLRLIQDEDGSERFEIVEINNKK